MAKEESESCELTMHLHHETAKAYLLSEDGVEKSAQWLPKSQIEILDKNDRNNIVQIKLPEWLAEKSGLI